MFRNREVKKLLILQTIVSLIAIMSGFFIGKIFGWILLGMALFLIVTNIIFTYWRYREISKLSSYLRDISSGNFSLDVRDNYEGELSILKSEIYKVTSILSEHATHLEQNKHYLTNAISDISHQLKTPLTSMTVMADLLDDPKLPKEKRLEFTHHIHQQLDRLDWLVSSLLKLSKLDSGTVDFKTDEINVKHLLEQSIETMMIPIDIKNQRVEIVGDDQLTIVGDFEWTKEAIINILKNCIEHTPESGQIFLRVSENPLFTEITIADNGPGIAKEDLPYIFQRFYKGKQASEQSVGIGLALAQRIITDQNGDIDVTSEVGQGTQFRIKFYQQKNTFLR